MQRANFQRFLATLSLDERRLVDLLVGTQEMTRDDLEAALGWTRNQLNGGLMRLSKRAKANGLSLSVVLHKKVDRPDRSGSRVYSYRLAPKMRDAMT
jgi:hypothetical protein